MVKIDFMKTLFSFTAQPESCEYLPAEIWQLRYDIVGEITPREYVKRLKMGWRRQGYSLFKPDCLTCLACRSLRVNVKQFKPNRSQLRAEQTNRDLQISKGLPTLNNERLALYDKFHAYQTAAIGWPAHAPENPVSYAESFAMNPFATQEWCYYLQDRMIAVGYLDVLPDGLSAIYFFYDPDFRDRSLGTFNVMNVLRSAKKKRVPYVYLGYFVEGCRSLSYKANFKPNELLTHATGEWATFRE